MKSIVTGKEMKALDQFTMERMGIPSLVLMERAGLSVVDAMKEQNISLENVLILCGSGNNGADGIVVGRLLFLAGFHPDICILGNPDHFTPEMKKQVEIGKNYGLSFINSFDLHEYTTIVDAVFGVGLSREVSGIYKDVICSLADFSGKIVSVDIPSGISADSGEILGCAVKADLTVTFAFLKAGLCFYPGAEYAGTIVLKDIGIYEHQKMQEPASLLACEPEDLKRICRRKDGNKGSFGKVLLIAGSEGMFGASYLCGRAAMKTGAGMLQICTREENRMSFSCFPEAMLLTYQEDQIPVEALAERYLWADAVGIGPGIGTSKQAEDLLIHVLTHCEKPLVIDADGLNLLKNHRELLVSYKNQILLTPHLGELNRLMGVSPANWKKNPLVCTKRLAKELSTVLICKDARTVIGMPDGTCYLNLSGNDGMATAGSGDVLTGILLGLLAQGYSAKWASSLGVYLHGMAGDRVIKKTGRAGLLAGDLIDGVSEILKELEESRS